MSRINGSPGFAVALEQRHPPIHKEPNHWKTGKI
jgi:hypothetical protein